MWMAGCSIDYHYLRNQLYVEEKLGARRAARHVPAYASALMRRYEAEMAALRDGAAGAAGAAADGEGAGGPLPQLRGWGAAMLDALFVPRQ